MRALGARRSLAVALAGMVTALAGGDAFAQSANNRAAFSVDRFTPAPGAGVFWTADGADVLPSGELSFGVSGSLMSRPLVLQDLVDASEVSEPVRIRLGFDVLAAIGLGTRYQIGVALPIVAAQDGDRLQGINLDETSLQPVTLGDLRLDAKLRLAGKPGDAGLGIGAGFTLTVPTGDEEQFAGEDGVVLAWRLIASYRGPKWRVGLNVGPRFRSEEVVLLSPARPHGNELVGAVGAEGIVPGLSRDQLSVVVEYAYARGDQASADSSVRGPSPSELRFGGRWRLVHGWSLGAGLGLGTSPDEIGSPEWRVMTTVRFDTHPSSDLDRDGIADGDDMCRSDREDRDGFQDLDGCPDPDNDGDTIPDAEDECPNEAEDFDRHRDIDGCPDAEVAP